MPLKKYCGTCRRCLSDGSDKVAEPSVPGGYECASHAGGVFTISVPMLSWQYCKHTCKQCSQYSCFRIWQKCWWAGATSATLPHCFLLITIFSSMQSSVTFVSACSGSHFKGGRFTFIAPLDNHAAAFLYDFTAEWNYVCFRKNRCKFEGSWAEYVAIKQI